MISSKDTQLTVATETSGKQDEAPQVGKADTTGGANLDKVRDILFGTELREVERRFTRLEERLVKETNDLKDDMKKRLDALDLYMRNESDALAGRIKAESDERLESNSSLSRELKESAKSLDRRISSVDELLSKSQRELRQQMLDQHQRLSDDIRQKVDEVLAALARETGELRSDKADRATLASLLTEMAMRLTNELRVPGAEDIANG
jgi:DNA repair exonuclease SbcCD ATPase subunit